MHSLGIAPLPWLDDLERLSFLEKHACEYDIIVCAWTTVARRFLRPARRVAPDAFLFLTVSTSITRANIGKRA